MTKELRQKTKTQLALAIAQGRSVALWARDNQVPRSTAYDWAGEPGVRRTVEACRRRTVPSIGPQGLRTAIVALILPTVNFEPACAVSPLAAWQ